MSIGYRYSWLVASLLLAAVTNGLLAISAQAIEVQGPVVISAETIEHDQTTGVVTATGHVEIVTGPYTLLADRITYDPDADRVVANGNVAILQPNGDVVFADRVELSDQLRNGFVSGIRVLLADHSRMAAAEATRTDGTRTELVGAVFSSCNTCAGGAEPPLWQLKATRVVHNETTHRIDYEDARLEIFGVPVLYTPFFSHPDPTVKRQTGVLAPTYGNSTALGARIQTPYYVTLTPSRDFTFAPIFTSREGTVLAGEYRERTRTGLLNLEGSITRPRARDDKGVQTDQRVTRSHVFANGQFDIDPALNWGFAIARASDDTYLRRYDFSQADTLVSNAHIESISGRDYSAVNAWAFQGLRATDDPGLSPKILPLAEINRVSTPGRYGQTATLAASALSLTRNQGTDEHRVSTTGSLQVPHVTPRGELYTLTASVRGDAYLVNDVTDPNDTAAPHRNDSIGRLLPQVALDWSLPLERRDQAIRYIVEPEVMLVLAPYGGNPDTLPNEDSKSFEFDDTNLFSATRFPGLDRWEGGARINYGVRFGAYSAATVANGVFGQSIRAKDDSTFGQRTGLDHSPSDFVGRLNVQWGVLDYLQRFRLDRESLVLRRNEINVTLGPPTLQASAGYVFLGQELAVDALGPREELNVSGRASLGAGWSATAKSRHNLGDRGGLLLAGFGLVYECDCGRVSLDYTRRLTADRDVAPSTALTLRVNLLHLGWP